MSSDDGDTRAATPQQVVDRVVIADVDTLECWDGPYEQDVGAAHTFAETFGAVRIAVVQDGRVIYGQDAVQAERQSRRHGGQIPVIDITDLEWTELRGAALAIGLTRLDQLSRADPKALADILLRIQAEDAGLLQAAGFDDGDLDDVLALANGDLPPLDALAGGEGSPDAAQAVAPEGMGIVSFTVTETLAAAWGRVADDLGGDDDARFRALLAAAGVDVDHEERMADEAVVFDFSEDPDAG